MKISTIIPALIGTGTLASLFVIFGGNPAPTFSTSAALGQVHSNPVQEAPVLTKWNVDKSHSSISFSVSHMVVSETEGSFGSFTGSFEHTKDDFSDAKASFVIDVKSIDTDNERRDNHLRGEDFFNVEQYPHIKFESTSFVPQGGKKYKLTGNLTMRDVTKPVTFDVTYGGTIVNQGTTKAGFKATTTIDRFDYNLKWDRATEAGSLVVGKEVDIVVKLELNKAK